MASTWRIPMKPLPCLFPNLQTSSLSLGQKAYPLAMAEGISSSLGDHLFPHSLWQPRIPATPQGARRAHIAILALPFHGHVNPMLPLVNELTSRGHQVSFVTTNEFAAKVAAAGGHIVLRPAPPRDGPPRHLSETLALSARDAAANFELVLRSLRRDPPDVLIHDIHVTSGPALATALGVPGLALAPTLLPYRGFQAEMGLLQNSAFMPAID
ncbi:glycosyl transferase family 28, partial [Actinobacteria bacterium OV450]